MTSTPCFSVSQQIAVRFARRSVLRRLVAVLYIVGTLGYLAWRATIFNADSPGVSLAYYAAEWLGFILGLTVIFSTWRYTHRAPGVPAPGLSVDVLIPTYREPLHVIRRTVMAARDLRYPHQTWVLDDASRPEVASLAAALGVHYRARGENIDAKAGNLNYGLQHSQADFIVVFDADHIAQPHALETLLGMLDDERIAMVQTPQDFYNTDAFQYLNPRRRAGLWHDQSHFYALAQACHESNNAATCVGTGVLYQRRALDDIGGFPVATVTEDFHTSLKLHQRGWLTRYLNEPVAFGIAAADLTEYYKTRHRWAHGNIAVLRHENLFTCTGLSLRQRLAYLSATLIYLEGWQQLLLFMTPLFALVLGWAPFEISVVNVLVVLFYPVLAYLLLQEFGCGFSRFWTNELFSMARWPVHLASAAALFGRKLPWRTSSKTVLGRVRWGLMLPQLLVFVLSALALLYAGWRLSQEFVVGPLAQTLLAMLQGDAPSRAEFFETLPAGYSVELVVIAGFWALFNMLRVTAFVIKVRRNASRSHAFFRFELALPVTLPLEPGFLAQTVAIAEDYLSLRWPTGQALPESPMRLRLHLPDQQLECVLAIERQHQGQLEGRLVWENEAQQDRLAATLYSIGWQRELHAYHAYFLTPSDVLGWLLGGKRAKNALRPVWRAGLLHDTNTPDAVEPVLSHVIEKESQAFEFMGFARFEVGQVFTLRWVGDTVGARRICVLQDLPIASLPHAGLNGRAYWRYLAIIEAS